jgi:hypothetical protein
MAFPTSPANNQTAIVNGIVYQWNATLGVWKRNGSVDSISVGQYIAFSGTSSSSNTSGSLIVSGGAGITGNVYTGSVVLTGSGNGITFVDGTTQTSAANLVPLNANISLLQSYSNQANANITYLQGALASENANSTLLFSYSNQANANIALLQAYSNQANANISLLQAYSNQANANIGLLQAYSNQANANIVLLFGIENSQNANIGLLQAYSNQANANISLLQSYVNQANANIVSLQALANTDYTTLTATAGVYGNSSYVPVITLAANGRITSITNTAITGGGSSSGYQANTILVANSAGYVSNSNLFFTVSNNNLIVANSIITGGGTGGSIIGANVISANTIVLSGTITTGSGVGGNISGANIISANTVNVSTALIFPDGTIQYTANGGANIVSNIALLQSYSNQANANIGLLQAYSNQANANISLLQSYVNTSNANDVMLFANVASLNTYSQAAFAKANTSLQLSGTTQTVSSNVTIQGNLSVTGNVVYTGNVTSVQITGNTGQFFGYSANGFNAFYSGIPTGYLLEPQIVNQITSNFNGYAGGINMQNINSGSNASSDLFISADNGTINDGFLDLGLASSTYNYPGYNLIGKNDAYFFVTGNTTTGGGNMIIGTGAPNDIIFTANGITTTNEVMRVSASGNNVTIKTNVPSSSNTTGSLKVVGGVGVTGNVYANRIYTNGLFWAANGNVISTGGSSGPVNTSAATPPATGNNVNDIWYNTTNDVAYRYTYDGTNYYWVDVIGPTVTVLANATYSTISSSRAIAFSLIFGG